MTRLRDIDLDGLRAFVEVISAPADLANFGSRVLPAVQAMVPSAFVCYAEIDPARQKTVAREVYPDAPIDDEVFDLYMFDHPVFQHWNRVGESRAARTSDFVSIREWHESGLYQGVYSKLDCDDSLAIGLPAPEGLVACICIERKAVFTDREREVMELARPYVAQAYRHAEMVSMLTDANGREGMHSIVIRANGLPAFIRPATARLLEEFFPAGRAPGGLPAALAEWVAREMGRFRLDREVPPLASEFTVRLDPARRLAAQLVFGQSTGEQGLLILREDRTEPLEMLAARFGLTRREEDVLRAACEGRTAAEIADYLFISRRTVDKHLERIYGKLEVDSRSAAVARALGLSFSAD